MSRLYDTLQNLVTGLGTIKDPTANTQWWLQNLLTRDQLENAYRGDWIARKVVNAPAEDMTREWRNWQANEDQIEALEETEKAHALQAKVKRAIIRARLYGGGALVIGVADGKDPSEPVDLDAVKKDSLKFLAVLNRYELTAGPRIYNVDSPWYTRPAYYTVATPLFGFFFETGMTQPAREGEIPIEQVPGQQNWMTRLTQGFSNVIPFRRPSAVIQAQQTLPIVSPVQIHPSRVIEFVGNELPDWRLIPMGGGWGDSVLQTVHDTLRQTDVVFGGIATMVSDAKVDIVKIPNLSKILGTQEYSSKLLDRFSLSNSVKSTMSLMLLDKEEDWNRIVSSFGGLPEVMKEFITLISGAAEIPVSRLFGQAIGKGLSGSTGGGEIDMRNYYDNCMSKQRTDLSPAMSPLDQILVRSALGKFDPNVHYDWAPLYKPDPKEVAAIAFQKAQATQIYVGTGLINEEAFREGVINQLNEDGTYPGLEDAIEEYGSEPEGMETGGYEPQPLEPMQLPEERGAEKEQQPAKDAADPYADIAVVAPANPIGLVKNPQGVSFSCGTCDYFDKGFCTNDRVNMDVDPSWCCNLYEHDEMKIIKDAGKTKKLMIIRHGATTYNNDDVSVDRIRGWKDIPLSKEGRDEAKRLGESFGDGKKPDLMVTSDLKRSHDTAKIISKISGVPIYEASQDFRPWDLGKYAGQRTKDAMPALAEYVTDKKDTPVPGGESFNSFRKRFMSGVQRVLQQHEEKKIAIVTHHRNERLLKAWIKNGCPEDGSIDEDDFSKKGEPTGEITTVSLPVDALRSAAK